MRKKVAQVTILVAFFTTLLFSGVIFKSQIKQVMAYNHLLPEPENLTELYFEDHAHLPKTFVPLSNYTFSFTVHNLENKTVVYPYRVYIKNGEKIVAIEQGQISLSNNQYRTIKENFNLLVHSRYLIVVELTSRNQQIDFWME